MSFTGYKIHLFFFFFQSNTLAFIHQEWLNQQRRLCGGARAQAPTELFLWIKIDSANLYVRKVSVVPSIMLAQEKALHDQSTNTQSQGGNIRAFKWLAFDHHIERVHRSVAYLNDIRFCFYCSIQWNNMQKCLQIFQL